jgi:hypothetical protein
MLSAEVAFAASVIAAAGAFVAACLVARTWLLLPVPIVTAGAWLLSRRARRPRLGGASLAVLVCGSAVGLLVGLSPVLMLCVALMGLGAWDLESLAQASRGAADRASARRVEKAHFARLSLILGAGALLGAVGLFLRLHLGFVVLLGLAALLAVGLRFLVRALGKGDK